jgi:low affinity Fe/Cu permease
LKRAEEATRSGLGRRFEHFAHAVSRFAGSTPAFIAAVGIVLAWGLSGPLFHYSNTWQLVINTGTTVVTFLMVFLIQRTQNKEALAVQLKLNEVVAALQGASNRLVNVEDLDEAELQVLHDHYRSLAELAEREGDIRQSHSLDEANVRHRSKMGAGKTRPAPSQMK